MNFHRHQRNLIGAVSLIAISALALSGCAASADAGSADDVPTLNVGYVNAIDFGTAYVGLEIGAYDGVVAPEFSLFDSGSPAVEAMVGGSLDIALVGSTPALVAASSGVADIRILAPIADAAALYTIIADPSVSSLSDLRGKKIAVSSGTFFEYFLNLALQQEGVDPTEVELINLQPNDGQAAFLAGNVDAVVPQATSRYLIQEKRPDSKVVFSGDQLEPQADGTPVRFDDILVTTQRALDEKGDVIAAFIDAFYNEVVPFVTDPSTSAEAAGMLATWQTTVVKAETDVTSAQQLLELYQFYDFTAAKDAVNSTGFADSLTAQGAFLESVGKLPSIPDMSAVVDNVAFGG